MSRVLDKNYYPVPFPGGSSRISSIASGDDTLEVWEFYNADGKVVFYWKQKKNSDGDTIDLRVKVPSEPANSTGTYKSYDTLT